MITNYDHFKLLIRLAAQSNAFDDELKQSLSDITAVLSAYSEGSALPVRQFLPLIHKKLSRLGIMDSLPEKLQEDIQTIVLSLMTSDILREKWLREFAQLLKDSQINIILLKGSAFSSVIYPIDAPRVGCDIDILTRKCDYKKVCDILSNFIEELPVESSKRLLTSKLLFERGFIAKQPTDIALDVHKELTNPYLFNIDYDSVWAETTKHPMYQNEAIRILSPEDNILHLAVHSFRHMDLFTQSLLDMHEIICQLNPDFDLLLERARRWGVFAILFLLFDTARNTLNTPLPREVMNELKKNTGRKYIGKKIFSYFSYLERQKKDTKYRLAQLTTQLFIQDSFLRGIKFQMYYMTVRVGDVLFSLKPSD